MKKYRIALSDNERRELQDIIRKGKCAARKRAHAHILLKADESSGGAGWTDEAISEAHGVSLRAIERVRARCVEEGMEAALNRRLPRTHRVKKVDGDAEAHLVSLICSTPPGGYRRWTLRLLASEMVRLEYINSVSHEGIRQVLKKTNLSPG